MIDKKIVFYLGSFSDDPISFNKAISRNILIARRLLKIYNEEDIVYTIDQIVSQGVKPYSLIYIERAMESTLAKREVERVIRETKAEIAVAEQTRERGMIQIEQTEQRTTGYGIQRRFGKKYSLDMLEE